jgi:hypothetical protein
MKKYLGLSENELDVHIEVEWLLKRKDLEHHSELKLLEGQFLNLDIIISSSSFFEENVSCASSFIILV